MAKRIAAVDGLRGVAIGLVLVGHLVRTATDDWSEHSRWLISPLRNPDLGVQVFFVLSGYLITLILLRERATEGSISLRRFYARRVLRIWPAYYVFLAVIVALSVAGAITVTVGDVASAATFMWNYSPVTDSPWLEHTWTLSVEEQFYLLWPMLLSRVRPQTALRVALAALVVIPVARVLSYVADVGSAEYFHLRADQLLLGCALAIIEVHHRSVFYRIDRVARPLALPAIALLVASTTAGEMIGGSWTVTAAWSVNGLAVAILLLRALDPRAAASRVMARKPLVFLGAMSFSVYLWQQLFTIEVTAAELRFAPVAIGGSVALGWISFRLVETPFLNLKGRFAGASIEPLPDPVPPAS